MPNVHASWTRKTWAVWKNFVNFLMLYGKLFSVLVQPLKSRRLQVPQAMSKFSQVAQSWDLCLVNMLRLVNNQKSNKRPKRAEIFLWWVTFLCAFGSPESNFYWGLPSQYLRVAFFIWWGCLCLFILFMGFTLCHLINLVLRVISKKILK